MAGTYISFSSSAGGFSQLTGDVTAGPGTGVQSATIAPGAVTNADLAAMAAGTVKANVTGGSASPTDVSLSVLSTANSVPRRDGSGNLFATAYVPGFTSTPTAAATTTLTSSSGEVQQFTGTSTQTIALPDATTLALGGEFRIVNKSTGLLTLKDGASTTLLTVYPSSSITASCTATGSAAGSWTLTPASTYADAPQKSNAANDANTLSLYRFSGSGSAGESDVGASAIALSSTGSPALTYGPGGLNAVARSMTSSAAFYSTSAIGNTANAAWAGGAWTVEFWIKFNDTQPAAECMLTYVPGSAVTDNDAVLAYIAYTVATQKLIIYQYSTRTVQTNITASTRTMAPGSWYHVAVTRTAPSGGNVTFVSYINGDLVTMTGSTLTGPNTSAPTGNHWLYIGGFNGTPGSAPASEMTNADISDWRWSNKVRTQAEVRANWLAGRS